jgi:hypothetical protein
MIPPHGNQQNLLTGSMQTTYFMNDMLPNQGPYSNRISRDFGLKEGLMSQIRIRWWVLEGGCTYVAMPRKAVQVIWIYKGFSYFVGQHL